MPTTVLLSSAVLLSITCGIVAQCDGKVKTLRVDTTLRTFSSMNFPQRYPPNLRCQWLLVTPSDNYRVRMDSLNLDLEYDKGCRYDHITIYFGRSTRAQHHRVCSGFIEVQSKDRYLTVVFESNGRNEGLGFQFFYFAVRTSPFIFPPSVPITGETAEVTTVRQRKRKEDDINTGVLVGGIAGGVCLIIILSLLCGRCMGRKVPRQPPEHRPAAFYHSHAPHTSTPLHMPPGEASSISAALMVQNNNSVFMVSQAMGRHINYHPPRYASQINAGMTNMGFDEGGEDGARLAAAGFLGPPSNGEPPPSYCASMLVTNPPKVPPSPRRRPPVNAGDRHGLSPPPLYAPRDSALIPITEQMDLDEDSLSYSLATSSTVVTSPSMTRSDPESLISDHRNDPGGLANNCQSYVVSGSGFPTAWPGSFRGRPQTLSVVDEGRPNVEGTQTDAPAESAPQLTTSPTISAVAEPGISPPHTNGSASTANNPAPYTNSPSPDTNCPSPNASYTAPNIDNPAPTTNSPLIDANSHAPDSDDKAPSINSPTSVVDSSISEANNTAPVLSVGS